MVDATPPAALAGLAGRLLADAEQRVPLGHTLGHLVEAALAAPSVEGAAITLMEGDGLRLLAATEPGLAALEIGQHDDRPSPARTALAEVRTVVVDDLTLTPAGATGWPSRAVESGWRSCAVVPVTGRGRVRALLSLYRRCAGPLPDDERLLVTALADLAAASAVVVEDRDAAIRAQQALAHQALHDGLTGLANRTLLLDRLQHELLVSTRRRTPLAVLFVDLDGFKEVNDTLGHAAGDQLLVDVARRLPAVLRAQDTVARLGGDEFVAICADLPADLADELVTQHVTALAARLARAVAEPPYRLTGREVRVSASVGSVLAVPGRATAESLLRDADAAMYRAKGRRPAPSRTIDLRPTAVRSAGARRR
jgi:diguanylate cyclase (GGDEF)-like protein